MNPLRPGGLPFNRPNWQRLNHNECRPPVDACDPVEHSRYRINELALDMQGRELIAEIETALGRPRMRPGDPGE